MADDTVSSAGDELSDVSQPTDLSGDSEVDDIDSDSAYALSDDDESDFDWEEEWQKSVQELKYVVTGLAIPFVGRWFGRRFAFWSKCVHGTA